MESLTTQLSGLRTPFEDLSNEAQDRLRNLKVSLDPLGKLIARARSADSKVLTIQKNKPAYRDIRLPKPGDVLSRFYKGRDIVVNVHKSGFEYDGHQYRSLSAIAKTVTGAHWNGLLFFGIVRQER